MLKRDPITSMQRHRTDSPWGLLDPLSSLLCTLPPAREEAESLGANEACASWPVRSCPESRESRREVSVAGSWLSLCGWLQLRLRTKGHCCSQGHLFRALLLVSGSESLPRCPLTRRPGSLIAASLGPCASLCGFPEACLHFAIRLGSWWVFCSLLNYFFKPFIVCWACNWLTMLW